VVWLTYDESAVHSWHILILTRLVGVLVQLTRTARAQQTDVLLGPRPGLVLQKRGCMRVVPLNLLLYLFR